MNKRKIWIIILAVLAIVVLGGIYGFNQVSTNYEKQIASLTISNVDLSKVVDGRYTGSHKIFPIVVKVIVVVKDHKIVNIELVKHQNGQGGAAEVIPNQVVKAQTLEVDLISGATGSSKVILKAIENALHTQPES